MRELKNEEVSVRTYHNEMDNGERRYRLISDSDNTSYIRTESSKDGGIQNSHYHKYFKEMYMVQDGKIDIYEYVDNQVKKTSLGEGDTYLVLPNIPHNVYMYPDATIHTVKYGKGNDKDWYEFKKLDELINNML